MRVLANLPVSPQGIILACRRARIQLVGHCGKKRLEYGIYREPLREKLHHHVGGLRFQLGTEVVAVAAHFRPGVLRH